MPSQSSDFSPTTENELILISKVKPPYSIVNKLAPDPGTLDHVHFPTSSVMLSSQQFMTYGLNYKVKIINTPFTKQYEKGSSNK